MPPLSVLCVKQARTAQDSIPNTRVFFSHIFTQRPVNDKKIERSYRRGSGLQQRLANSIGNFVHMKNKKAVVPDRNLQSIKSFLTLELNQYSKHGSTSSSREQVAASSNCSLLRNTLCLFLLSYPPKLCWSATPTAWPLPVILQSNPLIVFWNSLQE